MAGERDFFISYTGADVAWAEWIAQTLEDAGYQTVVQAWDFRPGQDFVHQMQQATQQAARTIAVLSPAYLGSAFGEAEWRVALASDTVPRVPQHLAQRQWPGSSASSSVSAGPSPAGRPWPRGRRRRRWPARQQHLGAHLAGVGRVDGGVAASTIGASPADPRGE